LGDAIIGDKHMQRYAPCTKVQDIHTKGHHIGLYHVGKSTYAQSYNLQQTRELISNIPGADFNDDAESDQAALEDKEHAAHTKSLKSFHDQYGTTGSKLKKWSDRSSILHNLSDKARDKAHSVNSMAHNSMHNAHDSMAAIRETVSRTASTARETVSRATFEMVEAVLPHSHAGALTASADAGSSDTGSSDTGTSASSSGSGSGAAVIAAKPSAVADAEKNESEEVALVSLGEGTTESVMEI
jgi:hypothetical protein